MANSPLIFAFLNVMSSEYIGFTLFTKPVYNGTEKRRKGKVNYNTTFMRIIIKFIT